MSLPCKINPLGIYRLPACYTRASFLESTGTQYINTQIPATEESSFSVDYVPHGSGETTQTLVGSSYAEGAFLLVTHRTSAENTAWTNFGSFNSGENAFSQQQGIRHTASLSNSLAKIDAQSQTTKWNGEAFTTKNIGLFASTGLIFCATAKVFSFALAQGGTPQANYIPAITPAGVPCMYDQVSGEAKLNAGSGSFIVGMTAAQAVQLANLPEGGGALTVSLPQSILNDEGEITDAAVRAALNKAAENGWTITLQYYIEQ